MKTMKTTLTLIVFCASLIVYGQNQDFNRWSIGLNLGGSDGHAPIRIGRPKLYQINYFQGNARYMFNNRFGLMATGQFNSFKIGSTDLRTNYINISLHGVVNAGDILKLNTISERLGLLVHGGFGFGVLWQKDAVAEEHTSPMFNKGDEVLAWSFGATPQIKVSERFSINADLSFIFHGRQDRTFDFQHKMKRNGINAYFLTVSIGATYYIGQRANKHADWTPTVHGSAPQDMTEYNEKINQLEKQYNERITQLTDSLSVSDADGDGVPDEHDLCPDKVGPWGFSGCPDTDGDGIPDHLDQCPDVFGSWNYQGCPEVSKEVKDVLDRALKGVNFETGRAVLTKDSYTVLNNVVTLLKQEPTYKLKISGHTDNQGSLEHNMKLSHDRAQAVEVYLESQGISQSRFIVEGFGPVRPVASNDTEIGRAKNRRVEFMIVF